MENTKKLVNWESVQPKSWDDFIKNLPDNYSDRDIAMEEYWEMIRALIDTAQITITHTSEIFGLPCRDGCVAPTGIQGTFTASGLPLEVLCLYRAWQNNPCTGRSNRNYPDGKRYPRRYLLHLPIEGAIAREVMKQYGKRINRCEDTFRTDPLSYKEEYVVQCEIVKREMLGMA